MEKEIELLGKLKKLEIESEIFVRTFENCVGNGSVTIDKLDIDGQIEFVDKVGYLMNSFIEQFTNLVDYYKDKGCDNEVKQ